MRHRTTLKLAFSAAILLLPAAAKDLFNGKDLSGWDGDPRLWRVEDGVIVGETDAGERKVEANTFLIWKGGQPANYDLRFEARVTGDNNSGVQYRSRRLPGDGWRLAGYQMDLHPNPPYLGMLYEEKGRGIACQRGQKVKLLPEGGREGIGELPVPEVDLSKWNRYRISVRDHTLRHYVNGELAAVIRDLDPEKRAMEGHIGLQLHAGKPMRAEFRKLNLTAATRPAGASADGETDKIQTAPGFVVEKLYDVPKSQGSWVSMTVDGEGRLICGDQYGGLYRVTPGDEPGVEWLPIGIGGAHGLLWHRDALYVTVNEAAGGKAGVYRVTDGDGDGALEKIEPLKELQGRGEHGPHSLVPSPDGEWIYLVAGNHTEVPAYDRSRVPEVWDEDQLIPSRPDARGHARDRRAPGGWIARFRPDGSDWELVSIGYRNPYDIAFGADGSLFAYDADMEWDLGLPWYRPTRICQVVPGSEFGWRTGTGKWPDYYEDSMPSVYDIGPGSPTALLSGRGTRFPAKYQRALFAFDWTFGTVHAIHLEPDGAGFTATSEELLSGKGLPLTGACVGADGAIYFLTGGRRIVSALWRVRYTGDESTEPAPPVEPAPARRKMDRLTNPSAGRGAIDPLLQGLELQTQALASDDRVLRYAARTAMELGGADRFDEVGDDAWSVIGKAVALARLDGKARRGEILASLTALDWSSLDRGQQLAWLRAAGLAFIRGGETPPAERQAVLDTIDAAYPATDADLNRELCRMLCHLRAPGVVGRTLALMDAAGPEPKPDWADLAARNPRYGGDILEMLANLPPAQVIHYAYCLRVVEGPWTPDERRRYFTWLRRLEESKGGMSYAGFIQGIREDALAGATPEERGQIADLPPAATRNPLADLPQPEGPGRAWTVDEVAAAVAKGEGDATRGAVMFKAGLCIACHRFGTDGGAAGPDLTALGGRFTARELAVAILEPSKEISDQYAFESFTREDGSQVIGRQVDEKDEKMIIAVNPFDFSHTEEVARAELTKRQPSPVSPMPGALINSMNEQEVRDLFAYLLGE